MAELAIRSFFTSFMSEETANQKIGIARAGNVIGGGDWSVDKLFQIALNLGHKINLLR